MKNCRKDTDKQTADTRKTDNRLVCRRGDGATKRRSDTQATGRGAHRYRVAGMHATRQTADSQCGRTWSAYRLVPNTRESDEL